MSGAGPAAAEDPAGEQSSPHDPDVVLVAVPVAYVPHVARLLAELDAQQPLRPVPRHRTRRPQQSPQGLWPVEELRRLSVGGSDTHHTIVAVLDALSARPDALFTLEELAAATGVPQAKVTGAFAGLSRLIRAHFDFDRYGLPFTKVTGVPGGQAKQVHYSVDQQQAGQWRLARRR